MRRKYPQAISDMGQDAKPDTPETRLCTAVLLWAIEDFVSTVRCKETELLREQAYWWLFIDTGESRLTAEFCCVAAKRNLGDVRAYLCQHYAQLVRSCKHAFE